MALSQNFKITLFPNTLRHAKQFFFDCMVPIPLPVHFKWEAGVRPGIEPMSPGLRSPSVALATRAPLGPHHAKRFSLALREPIPNFGYKRLA
jgi:hypothetical protein